jgi:hypothetical protein
MGALTHEMGKPTIAVVRGGGGRFATAFAGSATRETSVAASS